MKTEHASDEGGRDGRPRRGAGSASAGALGGERERLVRLMHDLADSQAQVSKLIDAFWRDLERLSDRSTEAARQIREAAERIGGPEEKSGRSPEGYESGNDGFREGESQGGRSRRARPGRSRRTTPRPVRRVGEEEDGGPGGPDIAEEASRLAEELERLVEDAQRLVGLLQGEER